MNRRAFIGRTAIGISAMAVGPGLHNQEEAPLFGHNGRMYRQVKGWGELDPSRFPVKDCHEMVQDSKGRLLLLTNETRNNVLIYNTRGKLVDSWGKEYPGAHGLTIAGEGKDEFLLITDTERHEVYKTTLDGKLLMTLEFPSAEGLYEKKEAYVPTETTVAPNGDIFVADGYGQQYILQYSVDGKLKGWFGGRGEGDQFLDNAHGICVDRRYGNATLLVTDRTRCCFKRFTMAGELLEIIDLAGACVCRPVIHGDFVYAAVLRSPDMSLANSGFVTILDKQNRVISNIGGTEPIYTAGKLETLSQQMPLFKHPHDVCVDRDENIYVAQWASGNVYPYKFERV